MDRLRPLIYLSFCASLLGTSVAGGQCGYQDCWGAIGLSQSGNIGFSTSHWSEARAYKSAQDSCDWTCPEMRTFKNACAAISKGANGSWTWAKGQSRHAAERNAKRLCAARSHSCNTVVWACSR